ncbi:hypothetical protein B0H13DRAFT_1898687 [Mycena leptocephala]|nr:hypothetical protein B0H13DRAFT_1898687 [Mycena leptocephala]
MAPTRTVLDSEAKRARRKETLARYAAKHTVKLRASAKERMHWHAAIALLFIWGTYQLLSIRAHAQTKTHKDGQLKSAAKYRKKNRESIRAADSLRRAKKCIETDGAEAYDERIQRPLMAKTQYKYERRQPSPRPKSTIASNAARRTLEILGQSESVSESDSDSDSEFSNDSPVPGASFYGYGAPRPRSPTPIDLNCNCVFPAYCSKCTCGCDYMCCLRHHENESDHRKWMKELTLEEEQLRRQRLKLVS